MVAGGERCVLLLGQHRADGYATAQAFGASKDVWDYPKALVGVQVTCAARAGLDFIEDQERSMLVAEIAQAVEEALRCIVDAALPLNRFDNHRRSLRAHSCFSDLQVAERRVGEAGEHGTEALVIGALRGRGQTAVGTSVEGLGEGKYLVFLGAALFVGVLAGELYRGLDRLGARVAEEDLVKVGGLGEEPGNFGLERHLVQVRAVDQLLRLRLDCFYKRRMAVA